MDIALIDKSVENKWKFFDSKISINKAWEEVVRNYVGLGGRSEIPTLGEIVLLSHSLFAECVSEITNQIGTVEMSELPGIIQKVQQQTTSLKEDFMADIISMLYQKNMVFIDSLAYNSALNTEKTSNFVNHPIIEVW